MDETKHKDIDGIYPLTDSVQVQTLNASDPEALKQRDGRIHDEVFGELGEGRVNYRGASHPLPGENIELITTAHILERCRRDGQDQHRSRCPLYTFPVSGRGTRTWRYHVLGSRRIDHL